MSSVNKCIIVGRLGEDPTLRYTSNGKAVANFSLATSSKNGEEGKESVQWHRIVVWDKLAETIKQYLTKGKLCYVEGRIASKTYEKDGVEHLSYEIVAQHVQFLSPKEDRKPDSESHYVKQKETPLQPITSPNYDDVPF